jgi:hypothetical protein
LRGGNGLGTYKIVGTVLKVGPLLQVGGYEFKVRQVRMVVGFSAAMFIHGGK